MGAPPLPAFPSPQVYERVDAADDAPPGARVVVLQHLLLDAELHERAAIGLDEEAAVVAVDGGLEEDRAFQAGFEASHCDAGSYGWRSSVGSLSERSLTVIVNVPLEARA